MSTALTFATFTTSRGADIWRIPLEVFPNFWAYVYVVRRDGFCVLIDAGSGTDASHENLLDGLRHFGLQPADLTHILLTHADIDHFGGLSKLRPLTSARVGVHELDLQAVAHHEAKLALVGRRLASFLSEAGLDGEAREQLLTIHRFSKAIYHSTPIDFTYQAVDMRVGPFELIHLPGHSPGHVAIRLEEAIFCGDMVVEGVTPHLSPESITPFGGLDHYLDSLVRLQRWAQDAGLVFNGHNELITDLPAQIDATRQNILRRMGKCVEALEKPLTIAQACGAVYGPMDGYNQYLVIEKTGAYVEYLYEHGLVNITNPEEVEQGSAARYQRLGQERTVLDGLERNIGTRTGTPLQAEH